MATPTSVLSTIVKEEIPKGIREFRTKEDPVWSDIISSSKGVTSTGLGRDWKFLYTYCTGLSGAYQFEANSVLVGNTIAFDNDSIKQFGAGAGWPARTETTAPAFFQKEVLLKEARGTLVLPLKWVQLDEFDSSIGSAARKVIQGTARKAARAHAMAFYTTDAAKFTLMSNLQTSSVSKTHTITIDNSSSSEAHGRIAMFENGMTVDLYDDTVKDNTVAWVVTAIDKLHNTLTIASIDDTETQTLGSGDTDRLVLRNSYGNQPSGLRSWMKDTGTIFNGSIDVDVHAEFSSLIGAETGPLTEDLLNKYVGSFYDRLHGMVDLDTIITTTPVTLAYLQNEGNLAWFERNGRRMSVKGGWTDIDYAYHGSNFKWGMSTFSEPNAVYIIKVKGNIVEHVPPSVPGMGSRGEFGNEVKFVAPFGGYTDIFKFEETSSAAITDNVEAPFYRICELTAETPQGIIITGLDEVEV